MIACLLAGGCAPSAEPRTSTTAQASRDSFAAMVANAIGWGAGWNLLGYGCYCGPDNAVGVKPIDARDACCFDHDHDWMDAGNQVANCNCNTEPYNATVQNGVVTCTAGQNACATYCCEVDKAFVQCIQGTTENPANRNYDRTQCEPVDCETDEDCEGGTWCNYGSCVPYCGGGGFPPGLAATPCPIETETTL